MSPQDWKQLRDRFQSLKPSWPTAWVIVLDFFALFSSWRLWKIGGGYAPLSILLLAWALLHFYLVLHEATHSAISRNPKINNLVGHIAGWIILMPFLSRQRSHLLHHVWTGHPKGDPANQRIIQRFSVMTREQADRLEFIWRHWIPLLTLNDRIGMWLDPFQKVRSGHRSTRIAREIEAGYTYAVLYVLFALYLAFSQQVLSFLGWYLPALLIQLFLEELANLPHHAETPLLQESDPAIPYAQQHLVTHSCRTLPFWSRFVLLHFNLHTAHHLFPWVPWHALPIVNREIEEKLPKQETRNELLWSLRNRRRPLLEIMGHYFDHRPDSSPPPSLQEAHGLAE